MESETRTLADFCTDHGIECHAIRLAARPDRDAEDWDKGASHWQVTLTRRAFEQKSALRLESYVVTAIYSMGSACKHTPTASEVLWSLLMDAAYIKAGYDFEEWATDLGYATDSRKAKRIYKACKRAYRDLKAFLGDLYDTAAELAANE